MNKCRWSKYQMKTMPIKQISNRSQTYPKIHPNNSVVVSLCTQKLIFLNTEKKVRVAELIDIFYLWVPKENKTFNHVNFVSRKSSAP